MATLKQINDRIQKTEPLVELVRGEGYCYYVFDNGGGKTDQAGSLVEKSRLVFETESVMVPYLNQQKASVWVEDGIAFGQRIRNRCV